MLTAPRLQLATIGCASIVAGCAASGSPADGVFMTAFPRDAPARAGQPLRVAGVKLGVVTDVEADGRRLLVTVAVDTDFLPVYSDGVMFLQQNASGDTFLELDPGTPKAGKSPSGSVLPGRVELRKRPQVSEDRGRH